MQQTFKYVISSIFESYSSFGMVMQERSFSSPVYRWGFNGKEKDDETKGIGEHLDYGMRVYDPRVGRFLSIDPYEDKFPWYSSYQFAGNNSISCTDIDGLEPRRSTQFENYLEARQQELNAKRGAQQITTYTNIVPTNKTTTITPTNGSTSQNHSESVPKISTTYEEREIENGRTDMAMLRIYSDVNQYIEKMNSFYNENTKKFDIQTFHDVTFTHPEIQALYERAENKYWTDLNKKIDAVPKPVEAKLTGTVSDEEKSKVHLKYYNDLMAYQLKIVVIKSAAGLAPSEQIKQHLVEECKQGKAEVKVQVKSASEFVQASN